MHTNKSVREGFRAIEWEKEEKKFARVEREREKIWELRMGKRKWERGSIKKNKKKNGSTMQEVICKFPL